MITTTGYMNCGCRILRKGQALNGDDLFAVFPCPLHTAAPELLEACKQALSDLVWIESLKPGTDLQASILLLRARIAKATGQEG